MSDIIFIAEKFVNDLISIFSIDLEEIDDDFYMTLACNISRKNPGYFIDKMHSYSITRLRAAIFGIGCIESEAAKYCSFIKSYLNHEDGIIVAETIDSLRRLSCRTEWQAIQAILKDSRSPYAKGAALRYATFALANNAIPLLAEHLSDHAPIVRENAVDELVDHFADNVGKDIIQQA